MKITLSQGEKTIILDKVNADIYPGAHADCLVIDGENAGMLAALLGLVPGEVYSGPLLYKVRVEGSRNNLPTVIGTPCGTFEYPADQDIELMIIEGDSSLGNYDMGLEDHNL